MTETAKLRGDALRHATRTRDWQPQKITITRRVTATEYGGTTNVAISLPRISMHVEAMGERAR